MKKIFFLTGESSGDTRGADLIRSMKFHDKDIEYTGICGEQMMQEGCKQLYRTDDLGVTGFTEVISKLPALLRFRKAVKRTISDISPDLVIAVDYPGFNIPMLKWAKSKGNKTCYYVLPQVWAWKERRKYKVMEAADLMLSIIPFEKEYYGEKCYYIGNPVINRIEAFQKKNSESKQSDLGIFPGSRENEIKRNLPVMAQSVLLADTGLPVVMNVPEHLKDLAKSIVKQNGLKARINTGKYLETLSHCRCALISSGTATLEAALLGIPFALIYRVSAITFMIAKALTNIEFIGLPNILLGKGVIPEFIQSDAEPSKIAEFISDKLSGNTEENTEATASELKKILSHNEYADNAAIKVLELLKGRRNNV